MFFWGGAGCLEWLFADFFKKTLIIWKKIRGVSDEVCLFLSIGCIAGCL